MGVLRDAPRRRRGGDGEPRRRHRQPRLSRALHRRVGDCRAAARPRGTLRRTSRRSASSAAARLPPTSSRRTSRPPARIRSRRRPRRPVSCRRAISRRRSRRSATQRRRSCARTATSRRSGSSRAARPASRRRTIHTHRDFAFNTEVYAKSTVGYRRDDVTVSVPRLFFGYATGTNLMFPFAVGATAALFSERPDAGEPGERDRARTGRRSSRNVPTMLGKLLEHDDEPRDAGEPALDLLERALLALGGRGAARAAPRALDRALRERRLRRHRLGGDVPHLRLEPPGRHEARLARQGRRRLRAPRPARGRRGARRARRARPARSACSGSRATASASATGSIATRAGRRSTATGAARATSSGSTTKRYLYFAGRADDLLKVGGQWVAPLEVEECLLGTPRSPRRR